MKKRLLFLTFALLAALLLAFGAFAAETDITDGATSSASGSNYRIDPSAIVDGNRATGGGVNNGISYYLEYDNERTISKAVFVVNVIGNGTFASWISVTDSAYDYDFSVYGYDTDGNVVFQQTEINTLECQNSNKEVIVDFGGASVSKIEFRPENDFNVYALWEVYVYELNHTCSYDTLTEYKQEPTCGDEGIGIFSCICGATGEASVSATGEHVWSYYYTMLEPTETEYGWDIHKCDACSDIKRVQVWPTSHVHSYDTLKETTQEPTCGEQGVSIYACECGATTEMSIPATGEHVWSNSYTKNEPTCGEQGVSVYSCECGATKEESIPATGEHVWSNSYTKNEPTCGEQGVSVYSCECGVTKEESIPATGEHTWDSDGVCTVCGETTEHKHSYVITGSVTDGDTVTVSYICSECQETKTQNFYNMAPSGTITSTITGGWAGPMPDTLIDGDRGTGSLSGYKYAVGYTLTVPDGYLTNHINLVVNSSGYLFGSYNYQECFTEMTTNSFTLNVTLNGEDYSWQSGTLNSITNATDGVITLDVGDIEITEIVVTIQTNGAQTNSLWEIEVFATPSAHPGQLHDYSELAEMIAAPSCVSKGEAVFKCAYCDATRNVELLPDETVKTVIGLENIVRVEEYISDTSNVDARRDWKDIFDGIAEEYTGWIPNSGWYAPSGSNIKFTLDKEYSIESVTLQGWSNWNYFTIQLLDKNGEVVATYNANGFTSMNPQADICDLASLAGASGVKYVVINVNTAKWGKGMGLNFQELTITGYAHTTDCMENVVQPTCTEPGSYSGTCTSCAQSFDAHIVPLGHTQYGEGTVTEPGCLIKGYTTYFCSVCREYYTDNETNEVGHRWSSWQNADGSYERHCVCEENDKIEIEHEDDKVHVKPEKLDKDMDNDNKVKVDVVFDIDALDRIDVDVAQSLLSELEEIRNPEMDVSTDLGQIILDAISTGKITGKGSDISFGIEETTTDEESKGGKRVFNITINDADENPILPPESSEQNGTLTLSLKYKKGLKKEQVKVAYRDADGNLEEMDVEHYDPETGDVRFKTKHLSEYMIYTDEEMQAELSKVFTFKGYSFNGEGRMAIGYDIDYEAKALYEEMTGETLEMGVVFAGYDLLLGNQPLDEQGNAISLEIGRVIKAALGGYSYTHYDFILTDITDDIKDTQLVIAAYLNNGSETKYIQSSGLADTVTGISYNEAKESKTE